MNFKKYNLFIFLLTMILVGIVPTACSPTVKLPRLADDAVVVAFGDSITYGTGASGEESYPVVLEKIIRRRVVNAGVPWEVTDSGLSRLPEILEKEKPVLLILCHGGNDQLRHLPDQQTADNIREMIRVAKQRSVAVVLVAVPSPGILILPSSMYGQIAKELKVPLEEKTLSAVLADSSLKADYIHPNAAGYNRLAESLAVLMRKSGAID
jgi:acyl-CoA thioesterase I